VQGESLGCRTVTERQPARALRTRIKDLRARYDLTQDDLARKVGVRRETILYLEKGKYNPSLLLAHEIAKALNTKIDDLFIFQDQQAHIREKGEIAGDSGDIAA
jgi:putative transcriptional regulator